MFGFLSDAKTAKNLEVLGPSGSLGIEEGAPLTKNCLLGVLQHTKTKCGARLLRANLLQPPYDLAVTEQRLDCVEELAANEEFFRGLQVSDLIYCSLDLGLLDTKMACLIVFLLPQSCDHFKPRFLFQLFSSLLDGVKSMQIAVLNIFAAQKSSASECHIHPSSNLKVISWISR